MGAGRAADRENRLSVEGGRLNADGGHAQPGEAIECRSPAHRPGDHIQSGGLGRPGRTRVQGVPLYGHAATADVEGGLNFGRAKRVDVEPARPGRGQVPDPFEDAALE